MVTYEVGNTHNLCGSCIALNKIKIIEFIVGSHDFIKDAKNFNTAPATNAFQGNSYFIIFFLKLILLPDVPEVNKITKITNVQIGNFIIGNRNR